MAREYGIWTESDGGFSEGDLWSSGEADERLEELVAQGETEEDRADLKADLRVREFCPTHRDDEQPADACEPCYAEE